MTATPYHDLAARIEAAEEPPMKDEPEAVAQWQRRFMYANPFDPPGTVYPWTNCSAQEATGHFERRAGCEYRPLYTRPADDLVRQLVHSLECLLCDGHSYESEGMAKDHAAKVLQAARAQGYGG